MNGVAKIYVQGPLKKGETELFTLLPTLLSTGFQKDDIARIQPIDPHNLTCESIFNIYDPFLKRGKIPPFSPMAAHLPMASIAEMYTFANIIQNAATLSAPEDNVIIILDSRAIARRDYFTKLRDTIEKGWDCLSLAHNPATLPSDADTSIFSDSQIYEHEPMTPITSGALALRLSYVKKIVKTILPFRDPLNYELIFQTLVHKVTPKYLYPPIFDCR